MRLLLARRHWNLRSLRVVLLGGLVLSHILARTSLTAEPTPSPRRFIPAKGLVAYLEYEGLDAHAAAWKASAAHGILVDGHAGAMMSKLAEQLLDRLLKADPGWKLKGADILAIHDHLMHHGFVIAVHDPGNDALATTIILKDVGAKPARDRFDQLVKTALGLREGEKPPAPVRVHNRDVFELEEVPETKPLVEPSVPDPAALDAPALKLHPVVAPARANALPPETVSAPAVAPAPASALPPATVSALAVAPASPGSPTPAPVVSPPDPPGPQDATPPTTPPAKSVKTLVSWWFEGNDLVLVEVPAVDSGAGAATAARKKSDSANTGYRSLVFDTIDRKEPDVTTSAAYISAIAENKDIKGFEPNGLMILDPGKGKSLLSSLISLGDETPALSLPSAKYISPADLPPQLALPDSAGEELPELPDNPFAPEIDPGIQLAGKVAPVKAEEKVPDLMGILGIDGLKRIVVRWGFQGKALLTDVRVEAPGPRKGLIACLAQPTFPRSRLPLVPRGAGNFVVGSFDAFGSYTKFRNIMDAIDPDLAKEIAPVERAMCEAIGIRGPEALRHVGPSWSVFRLPSLDGNVPADDPDPTAYAFVIGIDNPEAIGKVLDTIADRVNQQLAELDKGEGEDKAKKSADPPVLAVEKLKGPDRGYQLTSPARLVPWLNDDMKPTILVGKSMVALASNLERAREALSADMPAGNPWLARGELQKALECLPENLTFVAVGDPRDSAWPTVFEQLPGEVQVLVGMLGGFGDDEPSMGSGVLAALGIPRPGGFRVRIDPALIPKADQVRQYLFPSVLAATVDDRGFRLIGREAFPLACIGVKASVNSTGKWSSTKGFLQDVKLKLDLLGLGQ